MADDTAPPDPVATYRTFPCPECGDTVPLERVAVLDTHTMVDSMYVGHEDFERWAMESVAHQMVDHLLREGYIAFEKGRVSFCETAFPLVATLGVVSRGQVKKFEDRIAERQGQVARAVVLEAIRQIDNWGLYNQRSSISKSTVVNLLWKSLEGVLKKWSRTSSFQAEQIGEMRTS